MFGSKKENKFPDVDWYCDNCRDYLNSQSGFHDDCVDWTCTKCGQINPIDENEIIWEDDFGNDEPFNFNDFDDIHSYPGCTACGNPAFPKCKTSCPMFDN
ncbi:MAG: hypothetical protein CVU43_14015 [Chloroflexi bacterium HGW-Chloroflexi-5]|jgi:hypothetical protein|nr:MAG: hypothetical protein CVU43_14015 [Chloroflexi bacterium HGW-Chloroflexi-5]